MAFTNHQKKRKENKAKGPKKRTNFQTTEILNILTKTVAIFR